MLFREAVGRCVLNASGMFGFIVDCVEQVVVGGTREVDDWCVEVAKQ